MLFLITFVYPKFTCRPSLTRWFSTEAFNRTKVEKRKNQLIRIELLRCPADTHKQPPKCRTCGVGCCPAAFTASYAIHPRKRFSDQISAAHHSFARYLCPHPRCHSRQHCKHSNVSPLLLPSITRESKEVDQHELTVQPFALSLTFHSFPKIHSILR